MSTAQREEWHISKVTQWPKRLGQPDTQFPPNLRLSNEGIKKPVITMWNQWQVWKMKTKAGCHRHNIPQTLEDTKQWQLLFGQGSGTGSGCTWRDSLGLQLRIPAPFPKGTCSGLWPSTSLSENVLGTPECEPGHRLLLISTVSQYRYYPFRRLGQNPSLPSTSNLVSEQGFPLCLWGPWVWGNVNILYAVQQGHMKSESTLTIKQSKFSMSQFLWPQ